MFSPIGVRLEFLAHADSPLGGRLEYLAHTKHFTTLAKIIPSSSTHMNVPYHIMSGDHGAILRSSHPLDT